MTNYKPLEPKKRAPNSNPPDQSQQMPQMIHILVNNYILHDTEISTYYQSSKSLKLLIEGIEALIYCLPFSSLEGDLFTKIWDRGFSILQNLYSQGCPDLQDANGDLEVCLLNFYQNFIMQTVTQKFDHLRTNSMIQVNYILVGSLTEGCEKLFSAGHGSGAAKKLIVFVLGLFQALFRFNRGGSVEDAHILSCMDLFETNLVFS